MTDRDSQRRAVAVACVFCPPPIQKHITARDYRIYTAVSGTASITAESCPPRETASCAGKHDMFRRRLTSENTAAPIHTAVCFPALATYLSFVEAVYFHPQMNYFQRSREVKFSAHQTTLSLGLVFVFSDRTPFNGTGRCKNFPTKNHLDGVAAG